MSAMKETLKREPRLADAAYYTAWTDAIIRHTDCDNQGHVNNSVFATLFNEGRWGLFRDAHQGPLSSQTSSVVASITIDYIAELNHPNKVRLGAVVIDLGRTSLTFGQGIFDQAGVLVSTAVGVMVFTDADGRPRSMSPELRAYMDSFRRELVSG
jgi:acyl-CoA thioester hydrolase